MGSFSDDDNVTKREFKDAKELFYELKLLNLANAIMKTLSMGMSDSYKIAIEKEYLLN